MSALNLRTLSCFVALAISASASAVPDDDNEMLSLSLAELSRVKIITATMQEETPQSVPSSISVYTRDEIRSLGITRLEQLLNYVPGYQSSRSDDAAFIQGYSSRGRRNGATGREVLVLIDGQRLNSDFSGGAGFFDPMIALENVERVEFIHGPGSSIYGSNAIMGVINVITSAQNQVDLKAGSNRLRESSLQLSQGEAGKRIELFAKYSADDGESLSVYNADPSMRTYVDTRDPIDMGEAYLKAEYGELSLASRWSRRKGEQFYASGYVANDVNEAVAESQLTTLGWRHAFTDHLSLSANAAYSDRQFELSSRLRASPEVLARPVIYEREPSAELVLRSVDNRKRWLLGGEFRQPDIYDSSIRLASPLPDPALNSLSDQIDNGHRTIRGYFAQYQYDFSRGTSVILGVRQDIYSDFGQHTSPRVGVIQQIGRRDTVKLLYGEAFRAPNRAATSFANSPSLVGNPDLDPEVARTTEFVWLHAFNRAQVSTSVFDVQVEDAIHEVATGSTSQRTWVNESETVAGAEIEVTWKLAQRWSGRLAITHLFDEANDINADAATSLSGSIIYKRDRWLASVRAFYQGEREDAIDTDANATTEEYLPISSRTLMGLHAAYDVTNSLQLYGDVTNVFDREYVSVAQRYTLTEGVPERGRGIFGGATFRF